MDVASVEGGGKGEKVGKVRDEEMASRSDELDSAGEVYEVYRTVAYTPLSSKRLKKKLENYNLRLNWRNHRAGGLNRW